MATMGDAWDEVKGCLITFVSLVLLFAVLFGMCLGAFLFGGAA